MALGRKTGGRQKGTPNKVTTEIREQSRQLLSPDYWDRFRKRLEAGEVAPQLEAKLWAYAYGEPKQQMEVSGELNMAHELSKKLVFELHPGPSKTA